MIKVILKTVIIIVITIVAFLTLSSCEDVIDVDLNTAPPKLVIEASIKWEKGTVGNTQKIHLSTTTGYFQNVIPIVTGATVYVTDSNLVQFNFIETVNTGDYVCNNFNPVLGGVYILTVISNGQTYNATETLTSVPSINNVTQNNEGGITGDDIELKFFFQDNALEDNFYMAQFKNSSKPLVEFDVFYDRFTQGNEMFGLYIDEDLKSNDIITFTLQGISSDYYNYMNVLLGVSGSNSGGPFQTPPATVRGNIINQTNFDNYALGYFRLSEIDKFSYIVQ